MSRRYLDAHQTEPAPSLQPAICMCHRVVLHRGDTWESKKMHGGVLEFLIDRVVARDLVDYRFDFFITLLL